MNWQSESQLEDLIKMLVRWDSRSGTQGEIDFPHKLKAEMEATLPREHLNIDLIDSGRARHALTAAYMKEANADTVILISHFDTVHTDEFGKNEHMAFDVDALTRHYEAHRAGFKPDVVKDIASGEYLFGRGIMDMKMGLALHMNILERAIHESWAVNVIVLTVPDEEVDSAGMRHAVAHLNAFRETHGLTYSLILNSEPSFSLHPDDDKYYIYTGSIGKIMPATLFYGVETHAGEPLKGLNALYMSAYLTKNLEFSDVFREEDMNESTPPPITLKTMDLKNDYSTQTTNHVASLSNVFTLKQQADEIFGKYEGLVNDSMAELQRDYERIMETNAVSRPFEVTVMSYTELSRYAVEKLGEARVREIMDLYTGNDFLDDRVRSTMIIDDLMEECRELAPVAVNYFAPPYYPPVNNTGDPLIQSITDYTEETLGSRDIDVSVINYFNGISDLSYVAYQGDAESWKSYEANTPVWGETYTIPFKDMEALDTPFINIGPFGKDPHKLTERLHKESAFKTTPTLLQDIIRHFFKA
ncbi:M20/M25/M40 family metallo-hydrolase [Lacicoccus alkaliphilus]|uniref:Arginine utilization protein RocB n=1 Tax=Lacicoccus alkaliphilus DSM 16010 TaxID=1123231 RepID=A0A1M7FYZ4_9BACL|nr:M20/M25/M40 family metallo-hydrolase [Salinicoccus alkaliphilus]SHM09125.1 Arginine utilization protein RocB [Salinicoccus alkaliphilus DSM 16010]